MIEPLTIYAIGCISVPWLICRSLQRPENSSRAILRYRNERSSDQFSNGDKGLGASFGPGSRPTGHAAFGVDGASRFGPSRGVASDSSLHDRGDIR